MNKQIRIAITGGIGSGKSTVVNFIKEKGYTVIEADPLAKKIMETDKQIINKIKRQFGDEVYINNKLNTKYLAEKVFSNNENVKIINSIVHPVVIKTINEMFENEFKDEYIIFVEAALIYEAKIEKYFDYVVVVYSDLENRINRIKQRDNSNEDEITRRMENQLSDEEKKKKADFVIYNNGSLEELKIKVNFLINLLNNLRN